MEHMPPFHMAFPIRDIERTRSFYVETLGCRVGRESDRWIDFDFFGHQISAHVAPDELSKPATNLVDGDQVPVRHFGVVLSLQAWEQIRDRLRETGTSFLIEPHTRFENEPGEQATMFFLDPSGNAIELKAFRDLGQLFMR